MKKKYPLPKPIKIPKAKLLDLSTTGIQCRLKRLQIHYLQKQEVRKSKRKFQRQRQKQNEVQGTSPEQPLTTDDKREINETFIFEENAKDIINEEQYDEFSSYFNTLETPKILITTNIKPNKNIFPFISEIMDCFPHSYYYPRQDYTIKEICQYGSNNKYTMVMIWRTCKIGHKIDELIMIKLPQGPSCKFKISSCELNKEIYHHGKNSGHQPELLLTQFNTAIGRRVARFFASCFPQNPEFRGRQVVTFHNQRDFIFFRRHRYIFNDEGQKVNMQELGPRFTLKLKQLQNGLYNNVQPTIEFNATDKMYISRKKFYL